MNSQSEDKNAVHYVNAHAHSFIIVSAKINELKFKLVSHPSYLPDVTSSDYHMLQNLKKMARRSNEEFIDAKNE
jgi:hypothetical protein